ncbi:carbonic anhydrase 2-like [Convolutriloba macropyga]|uniref:carbonic anhydrase 2-like n=1 Tax=Convolutriloba macropyga TaxID=536237 RepID=UPI003F51E52E
MASKLNLIFIWYYLSFLVLYSVCFREDQWGYHINSQWGDEFNVCNHTHDQSPIKIVYKDSVYDPVLTPPILHGGWTYVPTSVLMLQNNGHTIELVFKDRHIRMHGAHLTHEFYLKQCHFHWGESIDQQGSEHWLNGHQYDAEMHCVFINVNFVEGTEAETYDREAWAVFGVLIKFDAEKTNPYIEYLLSHTEAIRDAGQNYSFNQEEHKADIKHLLPDDLSEYYRYQGSLTSPPCYEFVVWTIFHNPIHISTHQAERLFELHNAVVEQNEGFTNITGNFRPPQPLAGRTVFRSFNKANAASTPQTTLLTIILLIATAFILY